jgi:hypothetical protein
MGRTHLWFGVLLLATGLAAESPGRAQDAPAAVPAPAARPAFAYQLGQTTLDEARAYWSQGGVKVLRSGHMALGTGSGADGVGKVSAEKVLLVDVSGVDFEGLSTARFGFFDNRLYRIQASLASPLNRATSANLSDEEIKALGVKLRKKYGAPSEQIRTLYADKKSGPDVLVWKLPDGKLTLTANALNGSLILSNEKVEADIKAYVKAYCKTVNTPGHVTCW